MKVWIDQDLCTGDGLCEEIAPDVFTLLDDGLAYVREKDKIFATAKGNAQGAEGMAVRPDHRMVAHTAFLTVSRFIGHAMTIENSETETDSEEIQ